MNILILKPCCLGDVLMTTPLVATLRAAYPDAKIDYAVGDWARPGVATNPDIDEVLELFNPAGGRRRRIWQAIAAGVRLRWRRYDLAFVPDRDSTTSLVAYVAGIPRRFGIGGGGRGLLLTDAIKDEPRLHDVDVYTKLAEAAGLRKHVAREMKYVPSQASLELAVRLLRSEGFDRLPFRVAFLPGRQGGRHDFPHKLWPPERYSILANRLVEQYGGGVILLGGEEERELCFQIRENIDHPVLDLSGRTDVDGMGAVLQLCDAVISNDTGPMHLAVSVGTPTVGIFGPTSARKRGPYGSRHRAVQAHIYCGPCAGIGGPMRGCGAACIHRITVQDLQSVIESRAN
ncbi:MAG TPA: lipopolysaccharide heptosyltransferase II [Candidatus Solibacter sp.]|nr:lipopolysaccharide heptosyltransferase II [Candidatus Solibacter sp.]